MNTQAVLEALWAFANSAFGITIVSGIFLFILNRLYTAKPGWAKFEGAIITAIQHAEKSIPDNTESRGAKRLNAALKYVLKVQMEAGKKLSAKKVAEIREGIQIVHNDLSAKGTLTK